jgi:7,8-dihydropterin-6-yl-methyl-4-(beta-D-ribofuranosyl)aminobenzene 5'-phosphate synthase
VASSGELSGDPKEQSIFVTTSQGLVVIVSCAHAGIIPTLDEAARVAPDGLYLVLGGFHLFQKSESEVRSVVSAFRVRGIKKVAPCHCSGDRARELFKAEFGDDYVEVGAGAVLTLR